ncbi:MFS general substrate transporter [Panaeolus papilionaceus]|nr:MFS general substrate transporter [Panaeolus papilionaceus]
MERRVIDCDASDVLSESTNCSKTYEEKIEAVNVVLKDIGMGRYQWALFVLTGFGYFAGNLWPIVTALILPPVMNEFASTQGPLLKLGQNIGLLVGAVFWGFGADIWGRKISFNVNLLITGAFGVVAGASPNFAVLTVMATLWSLGVGGNMPVDAAIFLEFIPASHQYLLTVLSIWWTLGQLVGSLVAWPLIGKFSCPSSSLTAHSPSLSCDAASNKGWRYFLYSMGGLMLLLWAIRFFLFRISETPKYLVGKGRELEAVEVLEKVSRWNGRSSVWIDREKFGVCASSNSSIEKVTVTVKQDQPTRRGWINEAKVNHLKPLFDTREKTITTSLLISIWALIGLAFPLYNSFIPYYLATRGATFGDGSMNTTYRNQVILSVISIPASLLAGYMVSLPFLGRRGTLAIFTLLTGVFILLSTTSRSSNALLGWNCAYTFTNNVMYGVLYAMTPELFDSKDRGTASAVTAGANRIFGIMAPIIALYADLTTSVPIFIAGAVFLAAGFLPLLIPVESRDYEAR